MTGPGGMLEAELVLAEAADLARDGQYPAAVELLSGGPDDPAYLDLLARVHAQSGDLDAADAAWAAVLRLRPDDPHAEAGRRVLARIRSGRLRRRPVRRKLLAGGAVVLAAAVVTGGVVLATRPAPPVAAAQPDRGLRAELDRLHVAQSSAAAAKTAQQQRLTDLAGALAAPDVTVTQGDGEVVVTFDQGLFGPDAISPDPAGRAALEQWASVLKGQSVRVTVVGHGVAVAGGPAGGGSTVSLARAASAARVLATASGLPLTTFAVSSADQTASAHPDGGPEANRTVTLEVRPS
ncbi:hypothetical protein [Amycolatopsis jiangsuensis]|uniref:Flagellar motor protein MotB n=1 Tax=Amycolatopsis jiangsuensis TaxID=1181879 RepID=A0A840J3H0_9PSEU|nr:hypothetical protein [Amycolatopsis jiangsuensis]MBB4688423.1 flagellar motor protein MotB [Amycolatopsis jiangsuensis]